jgi:carbon-monoxide dehydrogenase medium subunit
MDSAGGRVKAAAFEHVVCLTTAQALALLSEAAGQPGAGLACSGTQSLGPMLNLRLAQPARLVDVSRIEALQGYALQGAALLIGAAVTHAQIEDGLLPEVTGGLLRQVASGIAYRAVRNRGTVGGSLANADPAGDWVSVMTLLDAQIVIQGARGERTLQAEAFLAGAYTTGLGEGELLTGVRVPVFGQGARWAYRKLCRKPGELADAIAALWLDPSRGVARAVLGGPDAMPHAVSGLAEVQALRQPREAARVLDQLGITDPVAVQWHQAMLRRAWLDIDRECP